MTNIAGIAWTAWTIFCREEEEPKEKTSSLSNDPINLNSPPTARKLNNKSHRTGFLAQKLKNWKEKRI